MYIDHIRATRSVVYAPFTILDSSLLSAEVGCFYLLQNKGRMQYWTREEALYCVEIRS